MLSRACRSDQKPPSDGVQPPPCGMCRTTHFRLKSRSGLRPRRSKNVCSFTSASEGKKKGTENQDDDQDERCVQSCPSSPTRSRLVIHMIPISARGRGRPLAPAATSSLGTHRQGVTLSAKWSLWRHFYSARIRFHVRRTISPRVWNHNRTLCATRRRT
jgi:hypothetical protein